MRVSAIQLHTQSLLLTQNLLRESNFYRQIGERVGLSPSRLPPGGGLPGASRRLRRSRVVAQRIGRPRWPMRSWGDARCAEAARFDEIRALSHSFGGASVGDMRQLTVPIEAGAQVAIAVPEMVRAALVLRGQGLSWRAVAHRMGYADHADIYATCRAHDAAMRNSERWEHLTAQAMDLAQEAGAQLGEALLARQLAPGQLPVVYGIAADKVVNMRRVEAGAVRGDASDLVGQLLERLHGQGGGAVAVKLEVSASGAAQSRVIDVEATE